MGVDGNLLIVVSVQSKRRMAVKVSDGGEGRADVVI
jgi:hypothetical protein